MRNRRIKNLMSWLLVCLMTAVLMQCAATPTHIPEMVRADYLGELHKYHLYPELVKELHRAESEAIQAGDNRKQLYISNELASLYTYTDVDFDKAISYNQKCLELLRRDPAVIVKISPYTHFPEKQKVQTETLASYPFEAVGEFTETLNLVKLGRPGSSATISYEIKNMDYVSKYRRADDIEGACKSRLHKIYLDLGDTEEARKWAN